VRLLADSGKTLNPAQTEALVHMATQETDVQVRSQLASSLRRLSGKESIAILRPMLYRDGDHGDPHLPMLLWWALEAHADQHANAVVGLFQERSLWQRAIARGLVERLARRYASYPSPAHQKSLQALLRVAPDAEGKRRVVAGINQAFEGRPATALLAALEKDLPADAGDPVQLALAVRGGNQTAVAQALAAVGGSELTSAQRIELIKALADARRTDALPTFVELLRRSPGREVRAAVLSALGQFDDQRLAQDILKLWSDLDLPLRHQAAAVLCSRKPWAKHLLEATVGNGVVSKADLPVDLVQRIELLRDTALTAQARAHFGTPLRGTSAEKDRRIQELATLLRTSPAGAMKAGHAVYMQRCGNCHQLFDEGKKIGPDLTGYERTNLDYMLVHIVDPSAAIREGYSQVHVETVGGRTLLGVIVDKDATRLVLADTTGQTTAIPLKEIAAQRVVPNSVMPERLLDDLTPVQLRDLFTYLRAEGR
jgi:putative heme-binding domain-containing protein